MGLVNGDTRMVSAVSHCIYLKASTTHGALGKHRKSLRTIATQAMDCSYCCHLVDVTGASRHGLPDYHQASQSATPISLMVLITNVHFCNFCNDMLYAIFLLLLPSIVDLPSLTWTYFNISFQHLHLYFIFLTTFMYIVFAYYRFFLCRSRYVYVCMHLYIYIYIYIHIYMYVYVCMYIYAYMYACAHGCIFLSCVFHGCVFSCVYIQYIQYIL